MRVRYVLSFGLLFMLFIWWKPLDASACSCIAPPPPEDALEKANAVFTGEVVEIEEKRKLFGGFIGKKVQFKVDKAWKGIDESEIVISTGQSDGDCGFSFVKGQKYLVYASVSSMYEENNYSLSTTICHRTTELTNATADLNALGEGQEVTSPEESQDDDEAALPWWTFALFVLGLVAIFYGFRYKKAQKNARG
ncbi:hypothetical protein [Sporosarcina highlanderae]|uniref:Tissue inhibitor of metalloproteinase n=1 Tax=Sporosarcina highlanderae TaxID=3035916 RepID=A0ABT8JP71_9BACL|nr:hypothetical protein [Sporosarcina highlanderae]MDN4606954.1 hypothetical protein [Sporosarcina highlanderae]